jgi:hypothetical protein
LRRTPPTKAQPRLAKAGLAQAMQCCRDLARLNPPCRNLPHAYWPLLPRLPQHDKASRDAALTATPLLPVRHRRIYRRPSVRCCPCWTWPDHACLALPLLPNRSPAWQGLPRQSCRAVSMRAKPRLTTSIHRRSIYREPPVRCCLAMPQLGLSGQTPTLLYCLDGTRLSWPSLASAIRRCRDGPRPGKTRLRGTRPSSAASTVLDVPMRGTPRLT